MISFSLLRLLKRLVEVIFEYEIQKDSVIIYIRHLILYAECITAWQQLLSRALRIETDFLSISLNFEMKSSMTCIHIRKLIIFDKIRKTTKHWMAKAIIYKYI